MLSDAQVESLAAEFVCVKIDPRQTDDALHHKRTGYLPEILFLDSSQNFLALLEDRSVTGLTSLMRAVLDRTGR